MTLNWGVVGYQKNPKIKETELIASEDFSVHRLALRRGRVRNGVDLKMWNTLTIATSFSYNPDNGKFTFLRKSGTWEIYYSF